VMARSSLLHMSPSRLTPRTSHPPSMPEPIKPLRCPPPRA
jgi:hypothetical protein